MNSQQIRIGTGDGATIFGILDEVKNSDRLVIFIHGLTGNKEEHQYENAVPVFNEAGYSTLRIDLYSDNPDARHLMECTLDTHVSDVHKVIDNFKEVYESIYLVGHSIGAPTIIFADHKQVKALGLWDPSFEILENIELYAEPFEDKYKLKWGKDLFVRKEFVKSLNVVNQKQIDRINVPTTLIFAGESELEERWRPHHKDIKAEHEVVVIKGADHGFSSAEFEKQLFETTLNWFNLN